MTRRKLALVLALALLGSLVPLGCGASFDPPTEIKSLRILGVSKDKPYAAPGDVVTLRMLWYDGKRPVVVPEAAAGAGGAGDGVPLGDGGAGSETPDSSVKITWLGGCINPPADGYSGCFQQYAAAFGQGGVIPVDGVAPADLPAGAITVGTGSHFSVKLPTDADLGPRGPFLHASQDPKLPKYGLSYVFFALCRGDLVPGDEHFPIHCADSGGNLRGPDDFVLGYSAIYSFAPRRDGEPYLNANPESSALWFGARDVTPVSCFGDDCIGSCENGVCQNPPAQPIAKDEFPALFVPRCADDGDPLKCPEHEVHLKIDPSTFEPDQVTNDSYGRGFQEQMWIDYYSTRGRFKSATKLLNDATRGYNAENGTAFYAPKEPGPVELWVVMHDNRGGVSWAGTTLMIE
jgi:hypothetical protein